MIMSEFKDIDNIPAFLQAFQEQKLEWMKDTGDYLSNMFREEIGSQKGHWKPLSKFTVERKGHSYKLIDTKGLYRSFNWAIVSAQAGPGTGEVWVGIIRDPRNATLMMIHENGARIRVTPKMRAFLHSIGMHLKKSTTTITIPPRPVMGPVLDREQENIMNSFVAMFDNLLEDFNVK